MEDSLIQFSSLWIISGLSLFIPFQSGRLNRSVTERNISRLFSAHYYPLLEDFGYIKTDRGQLILSVAVLNDILSIVVLAYAITLTASDPILGSAIVTGVILIFFIIVPVFLAEHLARIVPETITTNPTKFAIFLAIFLAFVMETVGIHAILGGFFAGLLIAEITHESYRVERAMKPVVDLTAPVFFFFVGMQFQIRGIGPADFWLVLAVVGLGIGAKVVGSILGGWLTGTPRQTTFLLAAAMPGRLAISVAAAEIGLGRGIISPMLYNAFLVLSTLSVFIASLAFRYLALRDDSVDIPGPVTSR
ncbi:MAG: cation:proton antiporter [Halodesulfurarchaeum sp.]